MCNRRMRTHDCGRNKVRLGRAIRSSRTKTSERTKGKEVLGTGDEPLPAVHGRKKVNKAGFALMSAFDVVVFMYLLRACPQSV